MNGVPKKKRKLEQGATNLLQSNAFSCTLQSAIAAANANPSSTTSEQDILKEAENDPNLVVGFDDQVKDAIKARLLSDEDFAPERFKSAYSYFSSNK